MTINIIKLTAYIAALYGALFIIPAGMGMQGKLETYK
jgi:hypothetical protein